MLKFVVALTEPEIVNVLETTPDNKNDPGKDKGKGWAVTVPGPVKVGIKPASKLDIVIVFIGPEKLYTIGIIGSPIHACRGDKFPLICVKTGCDCTFMVITSE